MGVGDPKTMNHIFFLLFYHSDEMLSVTTFSIKHQNFSIFLVDIIKFPYVMMTLFTEPVFRLIRRERIMVKEIVMRKSHALERCSS